MDAAVQCLGKQALKEPVKCTEKEAAALKEIKDTLENAVAKNTSDKSKVDKKVMRAFQSLAAKTVKPKTMKVSDAVLEKFIENFSSKSLSKASVMQSETSAPTEYCMKWKNIFPKYGADWTDEEIITKYGKTAECYSQWDQFEDFCDDNDWESEICQMTDKAFYGQAIKMGGKDIPWRDTIKVNSKCW